MDYQVVVKRIVLELLSLGLRRLPLERGRWRVLPFALRWSQNALPTARYRTVRTRNGFRLRVRLGDWLGRHVYMTGEYEPATTAVFRALLRPGDTVVDVGANVGYFTLLASQLVGQRGQVFAFEPVAITQADLRANLQLNQTENVVVHSEALSDAAGEVTFFVGPVDHRGTSSLRPLADSSEKLVVQTRRFDDLIAPDGRVNLIKIDVEGAELLALRGMEKCLRRDRPDIVVEVTDAFLRGVGHSAEALCNFLFELGYRVYEIDHNGLRPIENARTAVPSQFNALATARPALPAPLHVIGNASH